MVSKPMDISSTFLSIILDDWRGKSYARGKSIINTTAASYFTSTPVKHIGKRWKYFRCVANENTIPIRISWTLRTIQWELCVARARWAAAEARQIGRRQFCFSVSMDCTQAIILFCPVIDVFDCIHTWTPGLPHNTPQHCLHVTTRCNQWHCYKTCVPVSCTFSVILGSRLNEQL